MKEGERGEEKEKEKEKERKKDAGPSTDAGAEAGGAKPRDGPRRSARRPSSQRIRGRPALDREMQRLVQEIGSRKLAPDTTAEERYYSRSLTIRRRIVEFLIDNEGTTWRDLSELHARAANYAGCAMQTAARWIHQFTRVGARHVLMESVDHWVLERRER